MPAVTNVSREHHAPAQYETMLPPSLCGSTGLPAYTGSRLVNYVFMQPLMLAHARHWSTGQAAPLRLQSILTGI